MALEGTKIEETLGWRRLWMLIGALICVKLAFGWTGTINFEGTFLHLLDDIKAGDGWQTSKYFSFQANPIGFGALLWAIDQMVSFESGEMRNFLFRSLLAAATLALLFFVNKSLKNPSLGIPRVCDSEMVVVYMAINPLWWIYSGRILSDAIYQILAVVILVNAILIWSDKLNWRRMGVLSAAFLVLPMIKFNALALYALLISGAFFSELLEARGGDILTREKISSIGSWLLPGLATVTGLGIYVIFAQTMGFPVSPNHGPMVQTGLSDIVRNIVLYSCHFVAVAMPFSLLLLFAIWSRMSRKELGVGISASIILSLLFWKGFPGANLFTVGELNFGGVFDEVLLSVQKIWWPPLLFFSLASLITLSFVTTSGRFPRIQRLLAFLIVGSYALHSYIKPVQRYLLFVVFLNILFYLLAAGRGGWRIRQRVWGIVLIALFTLDLVASYSAMVRSSAYLSLGEQIKGRSDIKILLNSLSSNIFGNIRSDLLSMKGGDGVYCIFEYRKEPVLALASKKNILTGNQLNISVSFCE